MQKIPERAERSPPGGSGSGLARWVAGLKPQSLASSEPHQPDFLSGFPPPDSRGPSGKKSSQKHLRWDQGAGLTRSLGSSGRRSVSGGGGAGSTGCGLTVLFLSSHLRVTGEKSLRESTTREEALAAKTTVPAVRTSLPCSWVPLGVATGRT